MHTEAEWRNDTASQAGSNRFSSTSHVSMGQYSEYTEEYKTYWVEFTALFNNRRKRESRSPTQMYNISSIKIGLSASTLASFYRHQKSPRRTSVDKIIEWVEKEGNKKVDNSGWDFSHNILENIMQSNALSTHAKGNPTECFQTSDTGSNGRMPVGIYNANLDTSIQGNALNTHAQGNSAD
ncbi:hypothetical protein F8M41_008502 [Gigaspora margarita]|uniref:Uncharacterized protein n=1 Tax=Gigaspora margarita TaxID=4874 RepID=A0A8H3X460_GIGMA|nr:hypothetical protein F8M41_008502 [Gigaspora margarita]